MVGDFAVGRGFPAVEKRLPTGETVLDAMPKTHAGFADLPAKKDHLRSEHARKVDQALLDAFARATIRIDLVNPSLHLTDEFGDFAVLTQFFHEVRRLGIELSFADRCFTGALQASNIFHNLFDQRSKSGQ